MNVILSISYLNFVLKLNMVFIMLKAFISSDVVTIPRLLSADSFDFNLSKTCSRDIEFIRL